MSEIQRKIERDIDAELKCQLEEKKFWYLYPQPALSFRLVSDGKSETMQAPTMYDEFLAKGSF